MSRKVSPWGRLAGSVLVLAVLICLGTGPFLDGVRTIDGGALAAAAGIAVLTAWRWKIVAGGLGFDLSLPAAAAAYYRSLFLNAMLPGGIRRRRPPGGQPRSRRERYRSRVAGRRRERFAGQVVQVRLTVVVLVALPSPVRAFMPWVAIAVLAAVFGLLFMVRARPGGAPSG